MFDAHLRLKMNLGHRGETSPFLLRRVNEALSRVENTQMFSVDYPFVENQPVVDWAEQLSFSREDRQKILNGNARRLLRL